MTGKPFLRTCTGTAKKSGQPCTQPVMANGLCRFHGGSNIAPGGDAEDAEGSDAYREALESVDDGTGLRHEIALLRTMIRDMREAMATKGLPRHEKREYLGTIRTTMDRLAKVYRGAHAVRAHAQQGHDRRAGGEVPARPR